MARMDWDRIISIKAESLTDDEIEDLFPMVIRCDVDDVQDTNNLRALVKLAQEMLQHKDNQVESLLLECDELKEKVSSVQSASAKGQRKLSQVIASDDIERDNGDSKPTEIVAANYEYDDSAMMKNDKIKTLMQELESFEEENETLKRKLETLKEEMEDATENMDGMTEELEELREKNQSCKEEIEKLQRENAALTTEINELGSQQKERDRMIDDFSGIINEKVDEWKSILEERDTEIARLNGELSEALAQSVESITEQNKSEIAHLNQVIEEREMIIGDLQEKLLEAAVEINEGATLIEKLKTDARKMNKTGRRREQRELLKKIQDAKEKISLLRESLRQAENEATLKSEQLCEVLGNMKKYEDRDRGLADTIKEGKELKEKLRSKHDHVRDLINVVNNLEMLNSCREMQILALREKLGIPEDEEISIEGIALKSQEEARLRDELIRKNEALMQENFEMKSDVRTLRYKLGKLRQKLGTNGEERIDSGQASDYQEKMMHYHGIADEEIAALRQRAEIDDVKENIRLVIEENEALRKGMHEILDSIRDQDGKSTVEVYSGTLERLLEALDVRHMAGWYHPAMRLQERLNVVQGSNAELRSQLKQMRKELHRKDALLRKNAPREEVSREPPISDDSESDETKPKASEMNKIEPAYRDELVNLQRERASLTQENQELRDTVEKLSGQLEVFDADLRVIESGEDEVKRAFATKSRECAESVVKVLIAKRKCATLENLLNEESAKSYQIRKEAIDTENALRKFLAEMDKRNKSLESELGTLESNLSNSISLMEYNELRDKYEESNILLRSAYELRLAAGSNEEEISPDGEIIVESAELPPGTTKLEELYDISRNEAAKCGGSSVKRLIEINSELRRQSIDLQKELSKLTRSGKAFDDEKSETNDKYEEQIRALTLENENLSRNLEISRDEADMHYTTNSLRIFELDSLRHQILDLHAVSEDKETIARLGFELNSCKATEVELTKRKLQLENEILNLREDLDISNKKVDEARARLEDCRKTCSTRCRTYEDVIDFLRSQYAGSTSISALQRFGAMLKSVVETRAKIEAKLKETEELEESAKLRKETLADRLEIVERLKDILEERIGSSKVESIVQTFSENSQFTLNDVRLKRRITQLENESRDLNAKLVEYRSTIVAMEYEMINIQEIWYKKAEVMHLGSGSETKIESKVETVEQKSVSTQARVECQSKQVQSEACDLVKNIVVPKLAKVSPEVTARNEIETPKTADTSILIIKEQLDQALALASERSGILIKSESQIAELGAKISALERTIADKDSQLARIVEIRAERKESDDTSHEGSDKAALKSTISTLQKMINQKEETIARYQNLLKEDRDEHSKAAARFQQEIKGLRDEISSMREESERRRVIPLSGVETTARILDEPIKDRPVKDIEAEEKFARLCEKASTLEAELHIAEELGERWHRLAEERLQHMDLMRERLEEQHKSELESYRLELNKWQTEADALRQRLSENRMELAKGNISLVKELQERDNKIHELTVAIEQLQSEFDMMESMTMSQSVVVHGSCSTKMQEMAQALGRDQANHFQSELELLKRQIKSQTDKEKMYKEQISELKQQLSRRYMAVKSEERRISNREIQLERKLKTLEEELHKARIQLDTEYRVQEAKRIKTAEELSLWEKQKKWQQIAEKLKKEMKEKDEEYKKLSANYEKLRAVVSCMEREKWYLRSKLRSEEGGIASGLDAPANPLRYKFLPNMEIECQALRDRVKELTDRLETEDANRQTLHQLEQQKRRIAALEAVTKGNAFVIDQLEKLEASKAVLEKSNLRLESENFELRMELEKRNLDTPRLREKVEHLEKYVELLKVEKSSESSPRSSDRDATEPKKSIMELEKTVFVLKRVVEKLQAENKRLRESQKSGHREIKTSRTINVESGSPLKRHYEQAQKRVVALETDLQLAEQRIVMLENARKEEDNTGEVGVLRQQLAHKSELLDKVKQLLTRAAINEKALRQRIQQIELKQTLSTIPECSPTSTTH